MKGREAEGREEEKGKKKSGLESTGQRKHKIKRRLLRKGTNEMLPNLIDHLSLELYRNFRHRLLKTQWSI